MQHADGQMHIRQTQYYLLAVACQPGELFSPPVIENIFAKRKVNVPTNGMKCLRCDKSPLCKKTIMCMKLLWPAVIL